jgi:hypothetical protein
MELSGMMKKIEMNVFSGFVIRSYLKGLVWLYNNLIYSRYMFKNLNNIGNCHQFLGPKL